MDKPRPLDEPVIRYVAMSKTIRIRTGWRFEDGKTEVVVALLTNNPKQLTI